jgi:hypothetical protein
MRKKWYATNQTSKLEIIFSVTYNTDRSLDIETAVNAFIAILVPTTLRQKYKNHTSHDTLLH